MKSDVMSRTEVADESLEKHDARFHEGHFDPETESCKLRDDMGKGDSSDKIAMDVPKVDEKRAKEIFDEYAGNRMRSDSWLKKNLGIDNSASMKADGILMGFETGKYDAKTALGKILKLSGGIPKDAWKPGEKAKSDKASKIVQMLLGGGNGSWASSSASKTGGQFSQYFHAQGTKQYTNQLHTPTGLYKTQRPGGKALAREEDIPGMSAFHKNRPAFVEKGTVPSSLTPKELKDNFRYTANGSTYPMVGNIGGRNYIVKRGILPEGVRKNADLQDHIRKEVAADKFIREAGLNAPVCTTFEIPRENSGGVKIDEKKLKDFFDIALPYKQAKAELDKLEKDDNATMGQVKKAKKAKDDAKSKYEAFKKSLGKEKDAYKAELKRRVKNDVLQPKNPDDDKELVKIAEYVDGGVSLVRSWHQGTNAEKAKIQQQVLDAYPIISFLENVDAFKNDNVLVDKDSNIWFIDNGACFDYRAQGGKKLIDGDNRMATSKNKNAKPWYYERTDPTDYNTGYLGLLYAPDQKLLQEILDGVTDEQIVAAGRKYNFSKLVQTLPPEIRKPSVVEYAKKLDETLKNPPDGWLSE